MSFLEIGMGKRRSYTDETKAAAMAALLEGQSVSAVAKEYDIPEGTVKAWKSNADPGPVATEKRAAVGELLIDYLEANLRALRVQAETFSDPEWLRQQDAQELAVLHGVMTDKSVRLMEALGRADAGDAE